MNKHAGSSIMLKGCFSAARTAKLVAIKGNTDGAKYKQTVEETLFQSARRLHLEQKYALNMFQQDNEPNHWAKTKKAWLGEEKKSFVLWNGRVKAQT